MPVESKFMPIESKFIQIHAIAFCSTIMRDPCAQCIYQSDMAFAMLT